MRYFLFRSPRKIGDRPLEEFHYEPTEFIIEQKAIKYGNVIILSNEEIRNERGQGFNRGD